MLCISTLILKTLTNNAIATHVYRLQSAHTRAMDPINIDASNLVSYFHGGHMYLSGLW